MFGDSFKGGGTSGVGKTSLEQFAKHTVEPKIYFVGKSWKAADRSNKECQALNSGGQYIFLPNLDLGLIKNVDAMSEEIKRRASHINLRFLTQGTMQLGTVTDEGLLHGAGVCTYGRARSVLNLLPLLERATSLRRVVSAFVATKEGGVDVDDLQCRKTTFMSKVMALRAHAASVTTLSLEHIARIAPSVSFIHGFPGPVNLNIARGGVFPFMVMRAISTVLGPFVFIPFNEAAERHVFMAPSAMYPAVSVEEAADGVPLAGKYQIANGTDGRAGRGIYSLNQWDDRTDVDVQKILAGLRADGISGKVWIDVETEFRRITGSLQS